MTKFCKTCELSKPLDLIHFKYVGGRVAKGKQWWSTKCRKCDNKRINDLKNKRKMNSQIMRKDAYKRYKENLWNDLLCAYGNFCLCCKEGNQAYLTIEHLNGDGSIHRKQLTKGKHGGGGTKTYADLRRRGWPKGYGIMCANCQLARHRKIEKCHDMLL